MNRKWPETRPQIGETTMVRILLPLLGLIVLGVIVGWMIWNIRRARTEVGKIRELSKSSPEALAAALRHDARLGKRLDPVVADRLIEQDNEIKNRDTDIQVRNDAIREGIAIANRLLAKPEAFMLGEEHGPLKRWVDSQEARLKESN